MKLPDELDARLRHESARRGMTISELTREAIEAHLGGGHPRRHLAGAGSGQGDGTDVAARVDEILEQEGFPFG